MILSKLLFNLFIPGKCDICGKELSYNEHNLVCKKCLIKLIKNDNQKHCKTCWHPENQKIKLIKDKCSYCNEYNFSFNRNISFGLYSDDLKKLILKYKFKKKKSISKLIAKLIIEKYTQEILEYNYITYVPMSNKKKLKREFSGVKEVAKIISKKINIPAVNFIYAKKSGIEQHFLSFNERKNTLRDKFKISNIKLLIFAIKNKLINFRTFFNYKDNIKLYFENKKILLIDDIFTTGSTLNICSNILKNIFDVEVNTLTFARAILTSEDKNV